jgi:hypothetical protein
MNRHWAPNHRYLVAAFLGAIVGGIVVAVATRALPAILERAVPAMMARMGAEGCKPGEF